MALAFALDVVWIGAWLLERELSRRVGWVRAVTPLLNNLFNA